MIYHNACNNIHAEKDTHGRQVHSHSPQLFL